jgi:RNA polymerase sigma-70 factor (ECF subfamily)
MRRAQTNETVDRPAYAPTDRQSARDQDAGDLVLIAAIAHGDSDALEELYERYSGVVYRLALRLLRSPEMAEEVVQEVFWKVWRRSSSFAPDRGRVAQWLFGIAHHLCIDELRRLRARPTPVYEDVDHPIMQHLVDARVDVAAAAWAAELRRTIGEALLELPQAQRQAIELAYFGGMSHQEIAITLDHPLGTIKTRVRLGLQKLGGLLAARGLQSNPHCDL